MSVKGRRVSGVEATAHEYDLVGERAAEAHYYLVQTAVATHSSKGELKSTDIYREWLMIQPGEGSAGAADSFTCAQFSVQRGEGPQLTIPSLVGFTYQVDKRLLDKAGLEQQGQLYGISPWLASGQGILLEER